MSKKKIDVYRTGIYLRLSQGDEDIDGWEKQESCGNCVHRLAHSYAGRPKYYCAKHYLDKADGKCNISVHDSTMEDVVMKSLQLFIDMWVDSRKIVDMQREKQAQRLALAEKHLLDMEKSYERINKDLCDAYESYKLGMTGRETYLE